MDETRNPCTNPCTKSSTSMSVSGTVRSPSKVWPVLPLFTFSFGLFLVLVGSHRSRSRISLGLTTPSRLILYLTSVPNGSSGKDSSFGPHPEFDLHLRSVPSSPTNFLICRLCLSCIVSVLTHVSRDTDKAGRPPASTLFLCRTPFLDRYRLGSCTPRNTRHDYN